MKTISKWKARRSGVGMTITGTDSEGAEITVTNVISISGGHHVGPETGHIAVPVAVTNNGDQFALT